VLGDMQMLLVVKHSVLLRCVFESILTLFEWTAANDLQIGAFFSNVHTIDKLLNIIEGFSDDFRPLAAETLTYIFRSSFALE
jgi:hypothetical protein